MYSSYADFWIDTVVWTLESSATLRVLGPVPEIVCGSLS
jgi:hypothetical protein